MSCKYLQVALAHHTLCMPICQVNLAANDLTNNGKDMTGIKAIADALVEERARALEAELSAKDM